MPSCDLYCLMDGPLGMFHGLDLCCKTLSYRISPRQLAETLSYREEDAENEEEMIERGGVRNVLNPPLLQHQSVAECDTVPACPTAHHPQTLYKSVLYCSIERS